MVAPVEGLLHTAVLAGLATAPDAGGTPGGVEGPGGRSGEGRRPLLVQSTYLGLPLCELEFEFEDSCVGERRDMFSTLGS